MSSDNLPVQLGSDSGNSSGNSSEEPEDLGVAEVVGEEPQLRKIAESSEISLYQDNREPLEKNNTEITDNRKFVLDKSVQIDIDKTGHTEGSIVRELFYLGVLAFLIGLSLAALETLPALAFGGVLL